MSISRKLNVGFGVLVGLTFLVVARNYWGGIFTTSHINRTEQISVPTALASNRAQEDLLKMSAHVRAYLITGKSEQQDRYYRAKNSFDHELAEMGLLITQAGTARNKQRLDQLKNLYEQWRSYPDELFALSDRYIDNQPALKQFQNQSEPALINIQASAQKLLDLQAERPPSVTNSQILTHLAAFQNSLALLGASLRAYLITQNADFRFEYAGYALKNEQQWTTLQASELTEQQRILLAEIAPYRQQFLNLSPTLFEIVEGDRYREDLYIFNQKFEPLATQMLALLDEIVEAQQKILADDLAQGRSGLITAQWQTLFGSFLALGIALAMAILLRKKIADPIVRLTQATARVMEGDFDTKAIVESEDEVGKLADTFNQMTDYLKQSRTELESYNATLQRQQKELSSKNLQLAQALEALQDTQAQLIQTEKMSSLGQMVAGIAHEINNPVNFIHGNLHHLDSYVRDLAGLLKLYQQNYPEPKAAIDQAQQAIELDFLLEDIPQVIASMQIGTERIEEIVLSLRNFSRLDESEMKQAQIIEGIESTLLILRNRLGLQSFRPPVEVIKDFDEVPPINCYPGQLNQVFLNILANAIDTLDRKSHQPEQADWQPRLTLRIRATSGQVAISIIDNGEGIPKALQSKIFNPFFTTKPVGEGTGMGLSISHKIIVDQHKGTLRCTSKPGEGSMFYIQLPLDQAKFVSPNHPSKLPLMAAEDLAPPTQEDTDIAITT